MKNIETIKSEIVTLKLEIEDINKAIAVNTNIIARFKPTNKIEITHKKHLKQGLNSLKTLKTLKNQQLNKNRRELKDYNFKRANYIEEKTARVIAKYNL